MTLKIEDVEQYTEKKKENKENFSENLNKDLSIFSTAIKKYPLISLFFIFAVIFLFVFPYLQVHFQNINNVTKEAELENQYRATLAQIFGGIAIAIGLYYTWRRIDIAERDLQATQKNLAATQNVAQDNLKVAREGQINERFTRAIDQLGNDKMEIRLGGIFALERISLESEYYHWPIMEILTAYIRKNSNAKIAGTKNIMRAMDIQDNESTKKENSEEKNVSIDIQAILTVITKDRFDGINGKNKLLDLRMAHLEGADLYKANLEKALLYDTNLRRAILLYANLGEAKLSGANLEKAFVINAYLYNAELPGANLKKANLRRACLWKANLYNAELPGANLEKAHLTGANLKKANLEGVNLGSADLYMARLEGANLKGVNLEKAYLVEAYLVEANLKGVNLIETNLRRAFLKDVNLEGANLYQANLEGAILFKTNLKGSNLRHANLTGAEFSFADLTEAEFSSVKQLLNVKKLYYTILDVDLRIQLEKEKPELFNKPD